MGTNKKFCCNDLLAPRYKLQPVMDSIYIAEGQNLKFGSVVDCKGFLCGSTHLEPYAILYEDCDTTNGAQEANVLIMGEFNIEKLVFGVDATGDVLDKIVFYAKKNGIIIRPYDYAPGFTPPEVSSIENVIPEGTSQTNPLINAEEAQRMIDASIHEVTLDPSEVALGNVHLLDEVTSFAADAKILVDSETNGPGAMSADNLLNETAQNALAGNVAPAFDPTRTSENPYKRNELVVYQDKLKKFVNNHYGAWVDADAVNADLADFLHDDFCALSSYTRHFEEISDRYGDESPMFPAMKNSTYQFKLSATAWNVTSISSSSLKFAIYSVAADGTRTRRVGFFKNDEITSDTFNVVTPSGAVGFVIFFLGDLGESVDVTITNTSYVAEKNVAEKKAVYIGGISGKIFVEESKASGGKVWLKAVGAQWVVWDGSASHYYSNSDFATLLGVTQETSAGGEASCLPFASDKSLVIDSSGNVSIKDRGSVLYTDVVIFTTGFGRLLVANPCIANDLIRAQAVSEAKAAVDITPIQTAMTTDKRTQVYVTSATGYVYVEEQRVSGGKVWIRPYDGRTTCRFNGAELWIKNNTELATLLGKTLETSAKGVPDCIPFNGDEALVVSSDGVFSVKGRNNILYTDIVVFLCQYGRITQLNTRIWYDLARGVGKLPSEPIIQSVHDEFYEKIIGGNISEKFIFFTDPHELQGSITNWWQTMQTMYDNIKLYNDELPIDFVLCGGDLIAGGTTQDKAADMLGRSTALFDSGFKRYLPMLGNHDTNYLGTISDEDPSAGTFSQATDDALMFGMVGGKSYYTHEGKDTMFFILDSGLCENAVTSYMKEQLGWLAQKLLDCKKAHAAIFIHGITNNSIASVGNNFEPIPFASDVITLCAACNGKTSVTLYGETYDFTGAETKVEFMLGGHSHADANKTISGIPCVITTNYSVLNLKFDIVMPDYAAGKLYLVRVDKASTPTQSREISLS